jgi:hypothetical protein
MGRPFVELSQEQQLSILDPLAYKAKYRAGEEDEREFFVNMRDMAATAFYTSKIGYQRSEYALSHLISTGTCIAYRDRVPP